MYYILPLAVTLTIETGIYMILKHKDMRLFLLVSILNTLLNLGMNFTLSFFLNETGTYWALLGAFEVMTTLIEALVITLVMKFKFTNVLLFAFLANLASFLFGTLLNLRIANMKITPIIISAILFSIYLFSYGFVLFSNVAAYKNRYNNTSSNEGKNEDSSNDSPNN